MSIGWTRIATIMILSCWGIMIGGRGGLGTCAGRLQGRCESKTAGARVAPNEGGLSARSDEAKKAGWAIIDQIFNLCILC